MMWTLLPQHLCVLRNEHMTSSYNAQKGFIREFSHVDRVLRQARNVLIVPHTRPDPDAAASAVSLKLFIEENYALETTFACFSPYPQFLTNTLGSHTFHIPDAPNFDLLKYDVAIGCDSIERGFNHILPRLSEDCITISFDHHLNISVETDVRIIDSSYASTTELLYAFFLSTHGTITPDISTALLTGVIGDTGIFQHACTSPDVLSVSSELVRRGASISKIVNTSFAHKKIETLNLWGRALERARFNKSTGLVTTVLTTEDIGSSGPSSEEIKEVATILASVPQVKAAILLTQISRNVLKASLRSHKDSGINVAEIAQSFGGGGHRLSAAFELPGTLTTSSNGAWEIH